VKSESDQRLSLIFGDRLDQHYTVIGAVLETGTVFEIGSQLSHWHMSTVL